MPFSLLSAVRTRFRHTRACGGGGWVGCFLLARSSVSLAFRFFVFVLFFVCNFFVSISKQLSSKVRQHAKTKRKHRNKVIHSQHENNNATNKSAGLPLTWKFEGGKREKSVPPSNADPSAQAMPTPCIPLKNGFSIFFHVFP